MLHWSDRKVALPKRCRSVLLTMEVAVSVRASKYELENCLSEPSESVLPVSMLLCQDRLTVSTVFRSYCPCQYCIIYETISRKLVYISCKLNE